MNRFTPSLITLRLALTCTLVVLARLSCGSAQAEGILLNGAILHTGVGTNDGRGQILIENGKISAIGTKIEAPDAQVIDLSGQHLYPGMIASSTLLGLTEIGAIRATRDFSEVGQFTPDVQSWIAVNPDSELIPVARANGISHIVPVPRGGILPGQSGLVALDGWTTEKMVAKKPLALHLDWPEMELDLTPKDSLKDKSKWKSPEDLAKERLKLLTELDTFFQEAKAYAKARDSKLPPPLNPPWEAMLPALKGEIPIIIRADDQRQIKSALEWARTNQLRIIIEGGRDAAKVAPLIASRKVPVIFEHVFHRPVRDTDAYDSMFRTPAVLQKEGVLFAISTGIGDMNETEIRNLPYHAAQAVAYGLPPEEAIKSITLGAAQILGVADRLGSLEKGKEATLIATSGDLLDIRTHVRQMWIAGQSVNLETRHTRLYEKYRGRPVEK